MKLTLLIKPLEPTEGGVKPAELVKHDLTQFYEIRQVEGRQIKSICLHYRHGSVSSDPNTLLVELLVPCFAIDSFPDRQFGISFAQNGFFRFSGQDLIDLSSNKEVKTLLKPESDDEFKPDQPSTELPGSNKGSTFSANSNPSSTVRAHESSKSTIEEETKAQVLMPLLRP